MSFPKRLYVRMEEIVTGDVTEAFTTLNGAVEDDGPTTIGVYVLEQTTRARKIVEEIGS